LLHTHPSEEKEKFFIQMKQYINVFGVTLLMLAASTTLKAQSDLNVITTEVHGTAVHMSLNPFSVQNAIDSLSVLISETGSGSSELSSGLSGRIDSLAQLVVMLDSAQSLGTEGQVLQVTETDGTLHVSWVDISEYSAGTGIALSESEFSIGQAVGTTDDVTFDDVAADSLSASGELSVTGKTILNDSLIVSGSSTISGSLLVDSISVTDVINGQVGSIGNHNLDALNDVPGMGSPGAYLRVKSDSTGLEYATIEETTYTAGTGMNLSGSEFSIGQAVGTTDDVTFDDITADTLDATITFLDTAMIGHLNVGPGESMERFTVSYLGEGGPFSSYMENFVSATSDIHTLSSNLSAFQAETVSLNHANEMSESGIQGQVGTIKGKNFTGNGLRESYLGVSKDSLSADFEEGLTYESLIVASFFEELSMDEEFTNDPTAQLQMLSSFYGQLPIEAGFLYENSDEGLDSSETVAFESTVATKSSAFASYQSSGYRNVRQVYQANADSSSHAYGTATDDDFYIDSIDFYIDSIDFSTTEAQTILQTYNDKYVDFEFLEMTEQDSGLTVMHDDYGIALSTGTRYQQATDSTVTRIPAVAGLEMHAESGKTVVYADTIELRGVVQMYQDVELNGNLTAPNIVEQNMGTYIANEASYGTGDNDRDQFTYSNSPGELSIVPLLTDNDNTKQPVSEDYSFNAEYGAYISGDSARGTYLVSATMTVQNVSEDDVNSFNYLPPSGLISQHLFDLRPELESTEIFPGCQTSFYYLGDSTEVTVNLSCYVHHEDAGDLNVWLHHTNNSPSDAIAITGGSLGIRKLNHYK